ncbi:MAG: HU family DNA-binding protein [bacterium]
MNRNEFIAYTADRSGLRRDDCEKALTAAIELIAERLKKGEKVQLKGLGTFELRTRASHEGMHPITHEYVTYPETRSPALKFSKSFKNAVSDEEQAGQ